MYKENVGLREINNKFAKLEYQGGSKEVGFQKKTLVNCLLGINNVSDYKKEIQKIDSIMNIVEKPDIITDLSTKRFKMKHRLWYEVAKSGQCIAGTLPIYTAKSDKYHIDENELLDIIIEQMENGVGLITIHPTANERMFYSAKKRIVPITSRGGGMVIRDLIAKGFLEQNVYLRILPQIISHARKNRVVLSIGATFRSSNIFDSNDEVQKMEIKSQIHLAQVIFDQGVDVILESPGHARPKDIKAISKGLKKSGFPIMPLGPIPTDASMGMDHISSSIGSTIMGLEGCANIITAVTREEHTGGIPTLESIIEAIRAARISAHIIDLDNLNDVDIDRKIVEERSKSDTCVWGKLTKGCDRCQKLCPLDIK